jgi:PadR family transcriptional regulator PadR
MKGEIMKGHLELLLLGALEGGPAHGYALIERLRERSSGAFDLAEGTIYPALHRLEHAEYLSSKWVQAGGRRRRTYSLTRRGRLALAKRRREWKAFSGAVNVVVGP